MENKQTLKITMTLIFLGALSRLLPHPPNVTPLASMALLGGAYLRRRQALIFPLAALLASDLFLGLHAAIPFVYACFLATALIGQTLKENRGAGRLLGACLGSSLLFFVVTNFGVWLTGNMYSRDFSGLIACYAAAVPFYRNTALGDLFFTGLLFGLESFSLQRLASRCAAATA